MKIKKRSKIVMYNIFWKMQLFSNFFNDKFNIAALEDIKEQLTFIIQLSEKYKYLELIRQ